MINGTEKSLTAHESASRKFGLSRDPGFVAFFQLAAGQCERSEVPPQSSVSGVRCPACPSMTMRRRRRREWREGAPCRWP